MNAIQALCDAGGTVRITVFRANFQSPIVNIIANVIVSCTIIDKSELIPVNLFTVKGMLKQFVQTGKYYLDMRNSKDRDYPNFWFGTGFGDYITVYCVKNLFDLIPENATGMQARKFVEFRVLSDGTIQNVDIHNAYKQKRKMYADTLASFADQKIYEEEAEGELVDINSVIGVTKADDSIIVD